MLSIVKHLLKVAVSGRFFPAFKMTMEFERTFDIPSFYKNRKTDDTEK